MQCTRERFKELSYRIAAAWHADPGPLFSGYLKAAVFQAWQGYYSLRFRAGLSHASGKVVELRWRSRNWAQDQSLRPP